MLVAPGLTVRLVVETDRRDGSALFLDSMVYDANGATLVLAQTEPPIDDAACRGEIMATYVVQKEDGAERLGFPVCVTACIEDYRTAAGGQVPAVVVSAKGGAAPFSARRYLRVAPTARSRLDLYVAGVKAHIADISLGGVRFSYDRALRLEANESVEFRFDLAGEDHVVGARIMRTSYNWGRFRFAVARFTDMTARFEQALVRRTHAIERAACSRGAFRA